MAARRLLLAGALLLLAVLPVQAAQPNYGTLAEFILPWECGAGHMITWDPAGHWEEHKATGVAFDFRMSEGTPLYSPLSGRASFATDDRPFETTLGHYVDFVSADGAWLVRLAHLRDPQSGERLVQQGELIGYSGKSGVPAEHLHLEVFLRSGAGWVPPDMTRIDTFFGVPWHAFVEGAILTNDTCPMDVHLAGSVASIGPAGTLGEKVSLLVPLRNDSTDDVQISMIQVALFSTLGYSQIATIEGKWSLSAGSEIKVTVPAALQAAGEWYVGRVTYRTDALVSGEPAKGKVIVDDSPLSVVAVTTGPAVIPVGGSVSPQMWLRNSSDRDIAFDALLITGTDAQGRDWEASLDIAGVIGAGKVARYRLTSSRVLDTVGLWHSGRVGYRIEQDTFWFAQTARGFAVHGPQLQLGDVRAHQDDSSLWVRVAVRNIGSRAIRADQFEVWGWLGDKDAPLTLRASSIPNLLPGQAGTLVLHADLGASDQPWSLLQVGYWHDGVYYTLGLPYDLAMAPH